MLTRPDRLLRDLLLGRKHTFRLAQLEVDHAPGRPLQHPIDDAADQLAAVLEHVAQDLVLLGVPQPLEDHLLADLGRQAREVVGGDRNLDQIPGAGLGADPPCLLQGHLDGGIRHRLDGFAPAEDLDVGGVLIDVHADRLGRVECSAVGRGQRALHQVEQRLLGDPLLVLDLVERLDEVGFERGQRI